MTDPLPELHEEDYELISELIVYVKNEFAQRQEHFRYDVYIGDFIRGEKDGKECVMIALAVTGESDYYIWAELNEEENGYDIWLFPSPFGLPDPTILDTRPFYESEIEKIVRFGMPFGFIDENWPVGLSNNGLNITYTYGVDRISMELFNQTAKTSYYPGET